MTGSRGPNQATYWTTLPTSVGPTLNFAISLNMNVRGQGGEQPVVGEFFESL